MSAISGFCEKCNKFRKRHCDGNRNTCMSILFDTIEALQQKIEQLKKQINTAKIGWDTYKTYSEQLEQQIAESNKIIETQPQESVVKGVSPDAEIITNEKGGMQSKTAYGFHLIDTDAILALAEVLQYGASKYARDNWRKIPSEEHFNHMMIHYYAWLKGDRSDDHLGHMFCRAMMLYATAIREVE